MKGLIIIMAMLVMIAGMAWMAGCKNPASVQIQPDYGPIIEAGTELLGAEIAKADPVRAVTVKLLALGVIDAEVVNLQRAVNILSAELLKFTETAEDPALAEEITILIGIFTFQGEVTDEAAAYIKSAAKGLVTGINKILLPGT